MATLYLCGAGVSANSVPVMSSFNNEFIEFITGVQPFMTESDIRLLPEIKSKINGFDTIDTYANFLFLRNEIDSYTLLKRLVDLFITARALIGDWRYIDGDTEGRSELRQISWAVNVVEKETLLLSDGIFLTSWNYDCLMELGYLKLVNYDYSKLEHFERKYFKINGTVSFVNYLKSLDFNPEDRNDFVKGLEGIVSEIYLCKSPAFINYIKYVLSSDPSIKYIWDSRGAEKLQSFYKQFEEKCSKKNNNLVICGYSFPFVNRSLDQFIVSRPLDGIARDKHESFKVYIQDLYPEFVLESLVATLSASKMHPDMVEVIREKALIKVVRTNNTSKLFIPINALGS